VTVPSVLADDATITGVWSVLDGIRFRSTTVKPDGTVRLGYTGVGFPGHPAFRFDETRNAWIAVVPAGECDQIVDISHHATYRGHQCYVTGVEGTGIGLHLIGSDQVTANDLGFEMEERFVYAKYVDLTEITGYFDVYQDEFFPYWQRITFGFSPYKSTWEPNEPDPELPEVDYDRFRLGRFAVVNGVEQPVDGFPANAEALYDVTARAHYHGGEYEIVTFWPGAAATLRGTDDRGWSLAQGFTEVAAGSFEKRVHIGALYNYQEIRRNLLFDRWLAEHRRR
jgi:hypothetical protein